MSLINSGKWVLANLLAGNPGYTPNYMYVEFKNVESAGDTVADGTFVEANALGYYQGLTGSCDYLKIPIVLKPTITETPVTVEYIAILPSTAMGEHNIEYSVSNNSTIYAVSLVSLTDPSDSDSAHIISRMYIAADQQLCAGASSIGIPITITL